MKKESNDKKRKDQEYWERRDKLTSEIEKSFVDTYYSTVFEIMECVDTDENVLILGETGTGKEIVAQLIHKLSQRGKRDIVTVSIPGLPENLIESELFGYKKGAFSGADKDKPGLFEEANNSTIFLDEIGDMPLNLQSKLLRAIEQKEFYPLGSRKLVKSDFRVIAATNQTPDKLRKDLYYRIAQNIIKIPPLRERKQDILPLLEYFLAKREKNLKGVHISWYQLWRLLMYSWPGNVRELETLCKHLAIGKYVKSNTWSLLGPSPDVEFDFDKYGLPPPIIRKSDLSWGYEGFSIQQFQEDLNTPNLYWKNWESSEQVMRDVLLAYAKKFTAKPKYKTIWQAYERWKKENQFEQHPAESSNLLEKEDITISRDSLEALLQAKLPAKVPISPPSVEDAIETLSKKGITLSEFNQKFIKKFLESNPITDKSRETLSARAKQLGIDPKTLRKYLQKKEK